MTFFTNVITRFTSYPKHVPETLSKMTSEMTSENATSSPRIPEGFEVAPKFSPQTTDIVDIFAQCISTAVAHSKNCRAQKAHVASAVFSLDGSEIYSLSTCDQGMHAELGAVADFYLNHREKIAPKAESYFEPRRGRRVSNSELRRARGCSSKLRGKSLSPRPQSQLV